MAPLAEDTPLLGILGDLVAFRTTSGGDSNLALLSYIEAHLEPLGFGFRRTLSADGQRGNLFASFGGLSGGLLLSGHTDVVPVQGQDWSRPAFALSQADGRAYGRGVCDMKGFIACVLAAVKSADLRQLGMPLHLAFTYDEEIGCLGVRDLLADLARHDIQPAFCIVGEPTSMKVVRAHKGRRGLRCLVQGRAAHSSLAGLGVNAAEAAAEMAVAIKAQAQSIRQYQDAGFYVPYSTMAVCRFHSGFAANVIPEKAELDFDIRYLPAADPDEIMTPVLAAASAIQDSMRAKDKESSITVQIKTDVPALMPTAGTQALEALLQSAGASTGDHVAFTTEGGLYQGGGIPTVVCGPGNIEQAHTADEFIEISELLAYQALLARLFAAGLPPPMARAENPSSLANSSP
ncbi:acetylornithine deacetylase [Xylophilus sp. GW821-FHT01B05]